MEEMNPRLMEVFFDVQSGLPRQAPGDRESTLRAFELCSELPKSPEVLDIGSGPGLQTLVLAEACSGHILAVDTCQEYLQQFRKRVEEAGLRGRVEARNADMTKLNLPEASLDLIWCEGAAYIMGISEALEAWRSFLRDRAYLAFTELVWLEENPSAEVANFFREEYPAMTSCGAIEQKVVEAGYQLAGTFTLPDSAWWDDYYTPLESKLPSLKHKYEGDQEALGVIAMTEAEIDMRRRFGESYGYQFFVARKQS